MWIIFSPVVEMLRSLGSPMIASDATSQSTLKQTFAKGAMSDMLGWEILIGHVHTRTRRGDRDLAYHPTRPTAL